jgi:DNA-directed RNA polymerase specialized sigma subunit
MIEAYLAAKDKLRLDDRITEAGKLVRYWEDLLDQRRGELRRSRDLWDRVYVGRYLDRLPTQQLAMRCGITRVHVYRILKKIETAVGR